ncbi:MAG: hypothetical protein AAGA30_02615 [Planctomycetota bacterium]
MAKFYVQSENFRFVVDAADGEGAALWFVDRLLSQLADLKIDGKEPANFQINLKSAAIELGDEIDISEIGFGRAEVASLDSAMIIRHWFQLNHSMKFLLDQI